MQRGRGARPTATTAQLPVANTGLDEGNYPDTFIADASLGKDPENYIAYNSSYQWRATETVIWEQNGVGVVADSAEYGNGIAISLLLAQKSKGSNEYYTHIHKVVRGLAPADEVEIYIHRMKAVAQRIADARTAGWVIYQDNAYGVENVPRRGTGRLRGVRIWWEEGYSSAAAVVQIQHPETRRVVARIPPLWTDSEKGWDQLEKIWEQKMEQVSDVPREFTADISSLKERLASVRDELQEDNAINIYQLANQTFPELTAREIQQIVDRAETILATGKQPSTAAALRQAAEQQQLTAGE